ncbi:MAG: glutaredoxin family protein [Chloroflexota bacterium]
MFYLFRQRKPKYIVLYGKPGCHLCDDARELLQSLQSKYGFRLEEVDIRSDASLFRRYDIRIPVIEIDGKEALSAPVHERDLRRAVR